MPSEATEDEVGLGEQRSHDVGVVDHVERKSVDSEAGIAVA